MDLSEEYILMCREANKFLPEHEYKDGDFFMDSCGDIETIGTSELEDYYDSGICCVTMKELDAEVTPEFPIYRQDQLQEMMKENLRGSKFLLDFTDSGVKVEEVKWSMSGMLGLYTGSSFEQVWLKWVMDIKFNKKWNGKTWEEA